jgi:TolA-binding protein
MGRMKIPIIIVAVIGVVYLMSAPGINACFRQMQQGHSAGRGSALYSLSTICISTFRYNQAVSILQVTLDKYPDHPKARNGLYNYGLCREKLSRPEQAVAAYEKYLAKYPNDSREQKIRNKIEKLQALQSSRNAVPPLPAPRGLRTLAKYTATSMV